MGLLSSFRSDRRHGGYIGHFGLGEWWDETFTEQERRFIESHFSPMGSDGYSLTQGSIDFTDRSAPDFLASVACWFNNKKNRSIAFRMLEKAEGLESSEMSVLDRHFMYQHMIEIHYPERDKPEHFRKALTACKKQIALAPRAFQAFQEEFGGTIPTHKGFTQLAIIYEKQGEFQKAIEVCKDAKSQGWSGDWEKRIERCDRKLVKKK